MTRVLAAALFLLFAVVPAQAVEIDSAPKVHARLIGEHDTVPPGGTVTVALEENIRTGWHTYWKNPGDAGAPSDIKWDLPPGWTAGPIQWPYPKRIPVTPLMDYGYEGKVWLLTDIHAPADARTGDVVTLKATGSWLVCKEVCIPEEVNLQILLEIGQPPAADPEIAAQFASARALLPMKSPWPVVFQASARQLDLLLKTPSLVAAKPQSADFFPAQPDIVQNPAPQQIGFNGDGLVIRIVPGAKARTTHSIEGVVVLTSADGSVQAVAVQAKPGTVAPASFATSAAGELSVWFALIFAFIGGLILNVMPCVLPVLAMKVVSLANKSGADKREARIEGFAYSLGAILSFVAFGLLIVVLRSGGEQIGWGFQLQEPIVVAAFALLLFAVGLSLSGSLAFPTITFGGNLTQKGGAPGAFFTGVLAVAVAAPCTAPFMAAALGFALTQPVVIALGVFFALGLGFALPFLLIALWPAALRLLPKPGAWMLRLERILALPMYAAALWLLWVLSQQTSTTGVAVTLAAMVVVAIGAWLFTSTRNSDDRGRAMGNVAALIALLLALSGLWFVRTQTATQVAGASDVSGLKSKPYSEALLAQLRLERRPVFVNATAAWCITCLVNERAVLSTPAVHEALTKAGVTYIVADWTRRDAAITALLEKYQRPGVPLYLYFAPGKEAQVLPQVLTTDTLLAAIEGRSTP